MISLSNLWQRSPWPHHGRGYCLVAPHRQSCQVKCCSPSTKSRWNYNGVDNNGKNIVTDLASPLESETRIWDCTVIRVTICIGVLNPLVNGNDASQCPEVRPVWQNMRFFYNCACKWTSRWELSILLPGKVLPIRPPGRRVHHCLDCPHSNIRCILLVKYYHQVQKSGDREVNL